MDGPPPTAGRLQTIAQRLQGEGQRVGFPEDDDSVPADGLGHVGRRQAVLPLDAAEHVLRCQLQRPVQGIAAVLLRARRLRLPRPEAPQRVERRLLPRPAVRYPNQPLPLHLPDAAETFLQPAAHALGRP